MSASQENACLKRMTPSPNAIDAAIIDAFAGVFARPECRLGPIDHPFHVSIRGGRIIDLNSAPVLMRSPGQILKQSISNKQGEYV